MYVGDSLHFMYEFYDPEGVTFEELRDKWAMEVGRFVLAFGRIEGLTYAALRECPNDPISEALLNANLGMRLDLLAAICRNRNGERWKRLGEVLQNIKSLSIKRNLIAHNGLGVCIYVDAQDKVTTEQVIRSTKRPVSYMERTAAKDRVAFVELVKHREEAEALSDEFTKALYDVYELMGGQNPQPRSRE